MPALLYEAVGFEFIQDLVQIGGANIEYLDQFPLAESVPPAKQ